MDCSTPGPAGSLLPSPAPSSTAAAASWTRATSTRYLPFYYPGEGGVVLVQAVSEAAVGTVLHLERHAVSPPPCYQGAGQEQAAV